MLYKIRRHKSSLLHDIGRAGAFSLSPDNKSKSPQNIFNNIQNRTSAFHNLAKSQSSDSSSFWRSAKGKRQFLLDSQAGGWADCLENPDLSIDLPFHGLEKLDLSIDLPFHSLEKLDLSIDLPFHSLENPDLSIDLPFHSLEKLDLSIGLPFHSLEKLDLSIGLPFHSLETRNLSIGWTFHGLESNPLTVGSSPGSPHSALYTYF